MSENLRKLKSTRELITDFLSRITVTKTDACLSFCPQEHLDERATTANAILGKRMLLTPVAHDMHTVCGQDAKYGFCLYLERYPEADLVEVIGNILTAARRCYFWIDNRGRRPLWWWLKQFHKVKGAKILYAEQENWGYRVLASRYTLIDDLDDFAELNIGEDIVKRNVMTNLALGVKEILPCFEQDTEVALCFSGPSLNQYADQIYAKAKAGMPIITANGAYNWCIEHKILPAAQIILDGRKFNKRFVEPVLSNCQYLLCSQCDPELVASIPKHQVTLWHPYKHDTFNVYVREWKETHLDELQEWFPIGGGGTVALRGFPLLITLGLRKFHVYGLDSCLMGDEHHAFPQPEDDDQKIMTVVYGGRTFRCYPWMISQANEFMEMTRIMIGRYCQMEVYGDGLIAHAIRTLAETAEGDDDGSNQVDVLRSGETEPAQWDHGYRYPRYENGAMEK